MTYAGLGAILFRFVGVLLIGVVLVMLIPAAVSGTSVLGQVTLSAGIALIPAAILIIASKPLGKILAAGLE